MPSVISAPASPDPPRAGTPCRLRLVLPDAFTVEVHHPEPVLGEPVALARGVAHRGEGERLVHHAAQSVPAHHRHAELGLGLAAGRERGEELEGAAKLLGLERRNPAREIHVSVVHLRRLDVPDGLEVEASTN